MPLVVAKVVGEQNTPADLSAVQGYLPTLAAGYSQNPSGIFVPNKVNSEGTNNVNLSGKISTINSTVMPLGISGVYTGNWEEVGSLYSSISVYVYSDVDAATDGLEIQFSNDVTTVGETIKYDYLNSQHKTYPMGINAKYFRVVFTNGTIAQTSFRLQTILHNVAPGPYKRPMETPISPNDSADIVRAIISGYDIETNTYTNVAATSARRMLVSTETPPAGPGETPVSRDIIGDRTGTTDDFYIPPSGQTLQIRSFSSGIENTGAGVDAFLAIDTNGDLSVLNSIPEANAILDGASIQKTITKNIPADGTLRILARTQILTGGSYRTRISWSGVLF